jgi:hypothetical protein
MNMQVELSNGRIKIVNPMLKINISNEYASGVVKRKDKIVNPML